MINEHLINQILERHFSNYKEYNLLIFLVFTLIVALINIIQNIIITRKLEKYKSELKKTEMKFSVYNQLQIESLSKLFQKLTEFKTITQTISNSENRSPESYKQFAINWTNKFFETTNVFSKEKYIFPKDIKTQYSIIHQNFESIFDFIKNERDFKSNFRTNEVGDVVFEGDYQDMDGITEKLKQYNREQVFTQTIQNIEVIRKKIEEYFENIQ